MGQEMKFRVIPSILTDKQTVVKGENFNNWRTVGMAHATAMLFAKRSVDELIFLDVNANQTDSTMPIQLVESFSSLLDIPFAIGGGIKNLTTATNLLRLGAEKVVIGSEAIENPKFITELAETFGSQAVVVSIDAANLDGTEIALNSGNRIISKSCLEVAEHMQDLGAGEIILQSLLHDGLMKGMSWNLIEQVCNRLSVPVLASSGASQGADFLKAYELGASGVVAGAIFQFTENTPQSITEFLRSEKVPVRNL